MTTWAPQVDKVWDNGFGGSRGGRTIEGAVFHHVAGYDGQAYVANQNSRDSHPSYHIKTSGYTTGVVHPDRRPYSTSHSVDNVAITFEIDNSAVGGAWPVTETSLSEAIDICVHHARQQGLKKFAVNTPGSDQPGAFFIVWHSQYISTGCPGPYIMTRLNWIVDECNRRLNGGGTPTPMPKPEEPTTTSWETAPGGDSGAPVWPRGALMARIQHALKARGRYDGPVDGVGGPETAKGIQRTITAGGGYSGPIDGALGRNSALSVQRYGQRWGDYVGPIDGDPRLYSWSAFALGLERP